MIVNCKLCNAEFTTYKSKLALGRGKYCSRTCSMKVTNVALEKAGVKTRFKKGQTPHNFVGRSLKKGTNTSYVFVYSPNHPHKNKDNNVFEHRLVMEKHLGRYLKEEEEVHHRDRNGLNNSIENLELLSQADHKRRHLKETVHKRWIKEKPPALKYV